MSSVTAKLQGGGSLESVELKIEDGIPTRGDCLYAAQIQRSVILARTELGVDVDGRPFAPYNKTRPFYYYPTGHPGGARSEQQLKKDKAAVKRFASKIGRRKAAITRSGLGIRFDSYDSFKGTYLGRSNVDLRGPKAPHMLQGLICKAGGVETTERDQRIGLEDMLEPGSEFVLGFYGSEAERAAGHNSDDRPKGMPQRRFLGSTAADEHRLEQIIANRVIDRARKRLGS